MLPRRPRSFRFETFLASVALSACSAANSSSGKPIEGDPNNPDNPGDPAGDPTGGSGGSGIGPIGGGGGKQKDGGVRDASSGPALTPVSIDKCSSGSTLPSDDVTALKGGGPKGSLRFLYPYDKTVFPRGLTAPVLQWAPAAGASGSTKAVYLHLKSSVFEYQGCLVPTGPEQLKIPQDVWDKALAQNTGLSDGLSVELTTQGTAVAGPVSETWTIAQGSLRGVVYYNTYGTPLAGNQGAVMRIRAGQEAEPFLAASTNSGCTSCHSVSANGAVMVAEGIQTSFTGGGSGEGAYDLKASAGAKPPPKKLSTVAAGVSFAALTPDGSMGLSAFDGLSPVLFDTHTGTGNPISTLGTTVTMAMFSPSGKSLSYTNAPGGIPRTGIGGGSTFPLCGGSGDTISLASFSGTSFGAPKAIYHAPSGQHPAFPSFTPDEKRMVFALSCAGGFDTGGTSDLYLLNDLVSGKATTLDLANGMVGGKSILPNPGRDDHLNYFPAVHPIAVGGYLWVFFTSRRVYGNMWSLAPGDAKSKKIWVTALDLNAKPGTDPSHPAFYLPGQELDSGNIRAFSTLEPCKTDHSSCVSGIDCCGGACIAGRCDKPATCAQLEDKCTTTADCCDASNECVGGFCSFSEPPH